MFTDTVLIVLDVKPVIRLEVEKVRFTLDWTCDLVEDIGRRYEVWTEPPDVVLRNVRLLAGFRSGGVSTPISASRGGGSVRRWCSCCGATTWKSTSPSR